MSPAHTQKRLTLAISGSRTLTKRDPVWRVLDERAIYYLSIGYSLHLHLGDAQGVDALAIYWARERQIAESVTVFFASPDLLSCFDPMPHEQAILAADWRTDGFGAGPIRNAAMLSGDALSGTRCSTRGCSGADVLLAIRNRSALNRGTDNCVRQAINRHVAVQSYTMNGPAGEPPAEWSEVARPPAACLLCGRYADDREIIPGGDGSFVRVECAR